MPKIASMEKVLNDEEYVEEDAEEDVDEDASLMSSRCIDAGGEFFDAFSSEGLREAGEAENDDADDNDEDEDDAEDE